MARLEMALVFAKDMEKLVSFYRDGLGLGVVRAEHGFTVLGGEGMELALSQIPERYAQNIQIADPPDAREDNPIKLIFAVEDIVATRERLNAAGGQMQPIRAAGARHSCDGIDPEGNVFQITT
jgi:predicted enzyme related to lactoylglutathione lyase